MAANPSPSPDTDLRIVVESNPPESRLADLNIKCWPKWGCPPGKYQLRYDAEETCYLIRGKVKAYRKGCPDSAVEFGAGDLVTIPRGLSCTWDVSVAVDKHYMFESNPSPSPSS
ncbi:hypothetical protein MLD38_028187 [Melastoma candidum]|uniref:Uncharacterized protein n=1 Tax=Melastoma candidum TaxID=119954 RepID=A0ACB9N026_9MYRT|nr:hypothetical protein MLD38_028187 [Melastoma candidum]